MGFVSFTFVVLVPFFPLCLFHIPYVLCIGRALLVLTCPFCWNNLSLSDWIGSMTDRHVHSLRETPGDTRSLWNSRPRLVALTCRSSKSVRSDKANPAVRLLLTELSLPVSIWYSEDEWPINVPKGLCHKFWIVLNEVSNMQALLLSSRPCVSHPTVVNKY